MTELTLTGVGRLYPGEVPVQALAGVDLTISQGDFVAIEGPSGAGKSTLLNILALLDVPTSGAYLIDGDTTAGLSDTQAALARCKHFGFIFQSFHLLPQRTAVDNVMLGLTYHGLPPAAARRKALAALDFVGLSARANFRVGKLSGGERQRVAIARAVCADAPVLVADEPTGNLDSASSNAVMDVLTALNAQGTTVIVVTHDHNVAMRARRRLHVVDGRVSQTAAHPTVISPPGNPPPVSPSETTHLAPTATTAPVPPSFSDILSPTRQRSVIPTRPDGDRASTVHWRALARDILLTLRTDPGRTARLVTVVVISVMLALTTFGLAQTAKYQVAATFDADLNRRVAVGEKIGDPAVGNFVAATTPEALARVRQIPGVEGVLALSTNYEVPVGTSPTVQKSVRLFGVAGLPVPSSLLTVDKAVTTPVTLAPGQALIGVNALASLNLPPLSSSPTLWINGLPHEVVGVVTGAGVRAELLSGVIVPLTAASEMFLPESVGIELRTKAGAAQQVAKVAAVAWLPDYVDSTVTVAPDDPRTLRDSIEANVQTILLTLTVVASLAGLLMLSNAMNTSVRARYGELALRRAIGAKRFHLRLLMSLEAALIGLAGGIIGVLGSTVAVLVVTIVQRWQPVIDPMIIPLGLTVGVLTGLLGAVTAARRASRIHPASVLR